MSERKVFIFDLDDTLYWNVHDYCYPILKFEKFILDTLGHKAPHIAVLLELEHQIDQRRVAEINPKTGKKFGYSMDRFPGTLVEVYRTICSRKNMPFDKKIADEIWQIGTKAFDVNRYKKNGLVKGAAEVLDFLKERGDRLILLTRGDEYVQRLKINSLGLSEWFSRTRLVPAKDKAIFEKIKSESSNKRKIYSVDNSFRSDIRPALEADLLGIYIPCETWEFSEEPEQVLEDVCQKKLFIFQEIKEIKNRYEEL
jgi:putative hydrolase of the HAD superfamily